MALIGSSPLGLTFYSDDRKNTGSIKQYDTNAWAGRLYSSIFGNTAFAAFPDSSAKTGGGIYGTSSEYSGYQKRLKSPSEYHDQSMYDTSVSSLLEYTSSYPAMKLLASDFAYLKNLGVYPNNRLMIARRFPTAVADDLTTITSDKNVTPLATLISWVPDGEKFIDISVGENWESSRASFKSILDDMGKDLTVSKDQGTGWGGALAGGLSAIPLPGFMEGLQYRLLNKLGLSDRAGLPAGDPNIIREAMQRKLIGDGDSGSGLKSSFDVRMVVEYEQKFINNVDPTLVYYDLIANVLAFATSDSTFQLTGKFAAGSSEFLSNLISGDIKAIANMLSVFIRELTEVISGIAEDIQNFFTRGGEYKSPNQEESTNIILNVYKNSVGKTIEKYKVKILGVTNALTGAYSTPWHITIGNPKKPLFSSGDMLTTDVKIEFGPILAFNDLPSTVKVEFTLRPARNLGAQEIFRKFSTGQGRTYKRINLTYVEMMEASQSSGASGSSGVAGESIEFRTPEQKVVPREGGDAGVWNSDGSLK